MSNRERRMTADKFWSRVDRSGGPDACWAYLKSKNEHGYGTIGWNYKKLLTHRLAYSLHYGIDIASINVVICHSCDNPPCCNPRHLFSGTQADNIKDMMRKGRQQTSASRSACAVKGVKHHNAKLTASHIERIFLDNANGMSQREIAAKYGIARASVIRIIRRKVWKHVEVPQ